MAGYPYIQIFKKKPKQFTTLTILCPRGSKTMYVKPDSVDKTHAKHTYMRIHTRKNTTFFGPPIPQTLDIYHQKTGNHQKIIKIELLHRNVFMDVCGKYRAKRGLTDKNLFDVTTF